MLPDLVVQTRVSCSSQFCVAGMTKLGRVDTRCIKMEGLMTLYECFAVGSSIGTIAVPRGRRDTDLTEVEMLEAPSDFMVEFVLCLF